MGNRVVSEVRLDESSHAPESIGSIDSTTGALPQVDRRSVAGLDDPLGPVRSVVRRWRVIAVVVIVGALLGWFSAVIAVEADTSPVAVDHYQAKHVLVLDSNVPVTQAVLGVRNLNVLAKRITIGDVPDRVAPRRG